METKNQDKLAHVQNNNTSAFSRITAISIASVALGGGTFLLMRKPLGRHYSFIHASHTLATVTIASLATNQIMKHRNADAYSHSMFPARAKMF